MGLSRLRWGLAGGVALLALVATAGAMTTYVAHQLTVGMLAVGALALTLVAGLYSLVRARLRIAGELAAMRANPPRGELLTARRQRLAAIKAAGARPDVDALAGSTAAEEAGRAYIGRYLVATTVLIGLVGTFAGLMETLGRVAPLIVDKSAEAGLALLTGPLSGLHVTFGASLVAILATLSLALAQGDLALHEGQALALLEDLTTHELIPRLWAPADDPAERTVRAVAELKTILAGSVATALEGSARRLADNARTEGDRASKALEGTAGTVQKEVARLCTTVAAALDEAARKQTAALEEAARKQTAALEEAARKQTAALEEAARKRTTALEEAARKQTTALEEAFRKQTATLEETSRRQSAVLAQATETAVKQATAATEEGVRRATAIAAEAVRNAAAQLNQTLQPLFASEETRLEAVREGLARAASAVEQAATRITEASGAMEGVSKSHVETVELAARGVLSAFDRAVVSGGAALGGAATALAAAARDLRAGADDFGPRLTALSTELGPLGKELAQLVARDPEGDLAAVVLGELDRLGAGMDRLTELVRMTERRHEAPKEPPA
jgi:hypothetical protein